MWVINSAVRFWEPVEMDMAKNRMYPIALRTTAFSSVMALLASRAFQSFTQPLISNKTREQILIQSGNDYIRFGADLLGLPLKWSLTIASTVLAAGLFYQNEINRSNKAYFAELMNVVGLEGDQKRSLLENPDVLKKYLENQKYASDTLLTYMFQGSFSKNFSSFQLLIDDFASKKRKIDQNFFKKHILSLPDSRFASYLLEKQCVIIESTDFWCAVTTEEGAKVLADHIIPINEKNESNKTALEIVLEQQHPKKEQVFRLLRFGALPSEDLVEKVIKNQELSQEIKVGLQQAFLRQEKDITQLDVKSSVFSWPAVTMSHSCFEWDSGISFGRAMILTLGIAPAILFAVSKMARSPLTFIACVGSLVGIPSLFFLFERKRANELLYRTACLEIADKRFPNHHAMEFLKGMGIKVDHSLATVNPPKIDDQGFLLNV